MALSYTPKYAVSSDLQAAIGGPLALQELSDRANAAIDTDAVLSALRNADSKIDEYARGLDDYPFSTVPKEAVTAGITLAIYFLYKNVWRRIPQNVKDDYDAQIASLEALRDKKISWSDNTQPQAEKDGSLFDSFNPASDDPGDDNPRREALRREVDLL